MTAFAERLVITAFVVFIAAKAAESWGNVLSLNKDVELMKVTSESLSRIRIVTNEQIGEICIANFQIMLPVINKLRKLNSRQRYA